MILKYNAHLVDKGFCHVKIIHYEETCTGIQHRYYQIGFKYCSGCPMEST